MAAILVVEQDAGYSEQITAALRADGWDVYACPSCEEARRRAAAEPPQLVLASSALPRVGELLASFSRHRGGPGAVVLVPTTLAGQVTAAHYQADQLLSKPIVTRELLQVVRNALRPGSERPPAGPHRWSSSTDIFADVVTEVEAEAQREKRSRRARAPGQAQREKDEIDRKLEESLSGVLPIANRSKERTPRGAREKPPAAARQESASEVDKLLDDTLSSLEMPSWARKLAPAGESSPEPPPTAAVAEPTPPPAGPSDEESSWVGFEPPPELEPPPPIPGLTADAASPPPEVPSPDRPPPPPPPEPPPLPPAAEHLPAGELRPEAVPTAQVPLVIAEPGAVEAPFAALGEEPQGEGPAAPLPPFELPPAEEAQGEGPAAEVLPFDLPPAEEPELGTPAFPTDAEAVPACEAVEPLYGDRVSFTDPEAFGLTPPSAEPSSEPAPGPSASEPGEGETFGDYTLLERIASGGMAEVWKARRRGVEGFQKTVAIKKILSHLTDNREFVTMLIDEAKLAAQLNHNHITQIFDLGKVGEDFFIAMEYVDGRDLRTILQRGRRLHRPLPPALALMIAGCLARALDYAHRKRGFDGRALGLVHRDVSPQNVLISYEGEIKLCDFGIVKAVVKASTTQMGALKGKLQYMSPEQAWGKAVDGRSDVFSLGAVLFELLTGTKLFAGQSEISVLDAVRECRVRPPREVDPSLPEEVDRIVLRALAEDPADRYRTAGEMEHDIKASLSRLGATSSQSDLARYMHQLFLAPERPAVEAPAPLAAPEELVAATPLAARRVAADAGPGPEPGRPVAPAGGRRRSRTLAWAAMVVVAVAAMAIAAVLFFRAGEPAAGSPAAGEATPGQESAVPPSLKELVTQSMDEKFGEVVEERQRLSAELAAEAQRVVEELAATEAAGEEGDETSGQDEEDSGDEGGEDR